MPRALIELAAVLLLLAQGLVAIAPGRVLCIPVRDCGEHEAGCRATLGDADIGRHAHAGGGRCEDHEHGPIGPAALSADECGCHLHVPIPDGQQVPGTSRGDNAEFRIALLPVLVGWVTAWEFEPAFLAEVRPKPPDFRVSDQVLALRTTRLLI